MNLVLTKYGQLACGVCKKNPPIGDTGVCYACGHGYVTTVGDDEDEDVEVRQPKPMTAGITERVETETLAAIAIGKQDWAPPLRTIPKTRKTGKQDDAPPSRQRDESLKGLTQAELEAIIAAPASSEQEQRRKSLARKRLWHLKRKNR